MTDLRVWKRVSESVCFWEGGGWGMGGGGTLKRFIISLYLNKIN